MANMSLKKTDAPLSDITKRKTGFDEVALGYDESLALIEAGRCLNCKNKPCVSGCPVEVRIPDFIAEIRNKNYEKAYSIISETSSLPAVCGRVCPQENQCEAKCVRGIKGEPVAIGRLERFVADLHNRNDNDSVRTVEATGKKVAVIGSGPAGLTVAGDLRKKGIDVTVFEALHVSGGVLSYGIPEFRLPKKIVEKEIDGLKKIGVRFENNVVIGKTLTIAELFENGFDAVFIGSGAGLPNFMGIEGENLVGVYSANEFLTRNNLMKAYEPDSNTPVLKAKTVAVVGGGNVAMDSARTAIRLGADRVYIVYRRSKDELPARREEVEHAVEEGVEFKLLTNPTKIIGYRNSEDKKDPKNGKIIGIECVRMELGEPDASGRRKPIVIPNSEFVIDVDCVIMAIGTSPNPLIKNVTRDLAVNKKGGIVVDEGGATSLEGVFSGGDAVTGAATVILAMGAGKTAAKSIIEYLKKK